MSEIMDRALRGDGQSFGTARKLAALSSVLEGNTPVGAVIAADKAVFTMREATAVAEGKRNEQDAVENLIDRAAVYVTTWAQRECVKLCEKGGEALGAAIGEYFGAENTATCAAAGRFVGHWVGVALKPVVEKGVQLLAEGAKGVWGKIKDVGSSVVSTVAEWLGF